MDHNLQRVNDLWKSVEKSLESREHQESEEQSDKKIKEQGSNWQIYQSSDSNKLYWLLEGEPDISWFDDMVAQSNSRLIKDDLRAITAARIIPIKKAQKEKPAPTQSLCPHIDCGELVTMKKSPSVRYPGWMDCICPKCGGRSFTKAKP